MENRVPEPVQADNPKYVLSSHQANQCRVEEDPPPGQVHSRGTPKQKDRGNRSGPKDWHKLVPDLIKAWEDPNLAMAEEMLRAHDWAVWNLENTEASPSMEKEAIRLSDVLNLANLYRRAKRMKQCPTALPYGFPCRDRLCPYCNSVYLKRTAWRFRALAREMVKPLFITISGDRCKPEGLSAELDDLLSAFKAVRKRAFWRKVVLGGIGTVEVRSDIPRHLRPHLHLLVDLGLQGEGSPEVWEEALRKTWDSIAKSQVLVEGVSSVKPGREFRLPWDHDDQEEDLEAEGEDLSVDVRSVYDSDGLIRYITKPEGRSPFPYDLTPRELLYFAAAVKGRRYLITFGNCHRKTVRRSEAEDRRFDQSKYETQSSAPTSGAWFDPVWLPRLGFIPGRFRTPACSNGEHRPQAGPEAPTRTVASLRRRSEA